MNNGSAVLDRWQDTATLDCQPEDATSEAGVAVCRMTLVKYPGEDVETVSRTTLYVAGRLAERCRDGLSEGDVIEATGLVPTRQRPSARHPEVLVPDTPRAVRLRRRAPHIASAAKGARLPLTQARVVHCMEDPYDFYIGRGRDPHTNELGRFPNHYSHKKSTVPGVIEVATAEEAARRFKLDLWDRIRSGKVRLEDLAALHCKVLACWCWGSDPCHGEVLAAAAKWAAGQLAGRSSRGRRGMPAGGGSAVAA